MQRWKTLAPPEELTPSPVQPAATCACGAVTAADSAYCAQCGRQVGGRRAFGPGITPLGIGAVIMALVVGFFVGGRRGGDTPGATRAEQEFGQLRAKLSTAERTASLAQERTDSLRKQLMDRHDEVARQLAERNDALRKHLKDRNDAVEKQLADRDVSIDVLAQRTEEAAQETAALSETLGAAEAQLKAWQESQQAAARVLPTTPQPGTAAQPAVQEGADAFWARFDAEHPNTNGRALWEESMRAAAEELGPDHPDLRDRAASMFEANLERAEGGTPAAPPP